MSVYHGVRRGSWGEGIAPLLAWPQFLTRGYIAQVCVARLGYVSATVRPSVRSSVMYTVLSSLAACGRLGVAAAGVLFWHAAS